MTQWDLRQLLSTLLPGGVLGVAVALAPPAQAVARSNPAPATETAAMPVAARLQSICDAVSALADDEAQDADQSGQDPNILRTWWRNWHNGWGNGGWRPNWGNGGWRPSWGNGGWGNGGWYNGGWHNGGWGNWHGRWRW